LLCAKRPKTCGPREAGPLLQADVRLPSAILSEYPRAQLPRFFGFPAFQSRPKQSGGGPPQFETLPRLRALPVPGTISQNTPAPPEEFCRTPGGDGRIRAILAIAFL
jgi:hypothetical protein